ncbi:hypothetical protein [Streptomyces sp. NPDC004134]|uniref:hypothetical protein n=1 Tax=Streptomyces sp. NPDC004134 TaxID=3364691 RepID=UPI0036C4458F
MPVELGWDDSAQWHPHALRRPELDLICRATALANPDAGYPGPHFALISRFAPVCTEADAAVADPLLHEAFAALPGLDAYQRRTYAARSDLHAWGVRWRRDATSAWWYPEQDGGVDPDCSLVPDDPDTEDYFTGCFYSSHTLENTDFPSPNWPQR